MDILEKYTLNPLFRELVTLEYVLTHGYSENEEKDKQKYLEIAILFD